MPETRYSRRTTVQHVGALDAVRAQTLLAARELFVVVDGSGNPVALYIGNGTTRGGILIAKAGMVHSGLAGLSADDHPQYLLATGARDVSGGIVFASGFTVNAGGGGVALFNTLALLTAGAQFVAASPLATFFGTTPSNADGARSSVVNAGGYKADATPHYLGELEWEHDGSGNDEKGRLVLRINRANSGLGAMSERARLDDHLTLAGEHRSAAAKFTCATNAGAQTITTSTVVTFGTTIRSDSSAFSRSSTEVTCVGAGWVEIDAQVTGEEAISNVRQDLHIQVQRDVGGGGAYATVTGGHGYGYHRDVGGTSYSTTAGVNGLLLQVGAADKLRVIATAPAGTFQTIIGACRFTVRTIPSS